MDKKDLLPPRTRNSLLILFFLLIFILAAWAGFPTHILADSPAAEFTPTPTPSSTPLSPEIIENYRQTNGILLAGVLVVLIIVGGTFSVMRRKP